MFICILKELHLYGYPMQAETILFNTFQNTHPINQNYRQTFKQEMILVLYTRTNTKNGNG